MSKSMIFHCPAPLPRDESSGSSVRPVRLIEAFQAIGYEVTLIAGASLERQKLIQAAMAQAQADRPFDFVYSEPPVAPLLWVNRREPRRFVDFTFFRWCRRHALPVGLYYRDVHWRFDQYKAVTSWRKRAVTIPLYWFEWFNYLSCVDHFFVPSQGMVRHLPTSWPKSKFSALPPGCTIDAAPPRPSVQVQRPLQLFYVGGIQPPLYDLKPMFEVIGRLDQIVLTVCCREFEWAQVQTYYQPFDPTKIKIVHAHGQQLETYYRAADLFGLFWSPFAYLDFAMPVKIFESLGYGLPIITTANTETARFVNQEQIGWVVATQEEFRNLLVQLQANPALIAQKREQLQAVRQRHTWQARTQTVATILTGARQAASKEIQR